MITSEVLDAMLKGGCTAEQIVLAVKAAMIGDVANAERLRQNNRDRQRRHRERIRKLAEGGQRDGMGLDCHAPVTVTDVTKERSPTPPKENNIYTPHTPQRESFREEEVFTFDDFWALYPDKTGKPDAKSSFVHALYRAEPAQIRDGLKRVMAQWEHPKFIPHPARWLDRDGWNDPMIPKRERKRTRGRRGKETFVMTPERRAAALQIYLKEHYWRASWGKRPTEAELEAAKALCAQASSVDSSCAF